MENDDQSDHRRVRVSPLSLAQRLEDIARLRRESDEASDAFDVCKSRYKSMGLQGLDPYLDHSGLGIKTAAPGLAGRIIALALEDPSHGCQRISKKLTDAGSPISHVTVQSILNRHHLGHRTARIQALEEEVLRGTIPLTPQRTEWIDSVNPSFCEREHDPDRPYRVASMAHSSVSRIPGLGRLHFHVVLDIWSLQAFAVAATDTQPEWSVSVLHNDLLPEASARGLKVEVVRTTNDSTYTGPVAHIFPLYLDLNDIQQEFRTTPDGHLRRFFGLLHEDFVAKTRKRAYNGLERYQAELDSWIAHYNENTGLPGWPNRGESPTTKLRNWTADQGMAESDGNSSTP